MHIVWNILWNLNICQKHIYEKSLFSKHFILKHQGSFALQWRNSNFFFIFIFIFDFNRVIILYLISRALMDLHTSAAFIKPTSETSEPETSRISQDVSTNANRTSSFNNFLRLAIAATAIYHLEFNSLNVRMYTMHDPIFWTKHNEGFLTIYAQEMFRKVSRATVSTTQECPYSPMWCLNTG